MIKLIFLVALSSTVVFSQKNFDKFLEEISEKDDTVKIKLLCDSALDNRDKNFQLALLYSNEAVSIAKSIKDTNLLIKALNTSGAVFQNNGKYDSAITQYSEALKIAEETNSLNLKIDCYGYLTSACELKNDLRKALFYLRKYETLNDTFMRIANTEKIAEIEAIYKMERSEKENFLLHKDLELKETQRNFLLGAVLLFLIFAVITYKRYRSQKADSEQLLKVNTMKNTLLRIIAHDLKTPFNVIFGYTEILQEDLKSISDEEKLSYLESIRKASRLSIELLENLTMWSKSQADKIEFKPAPVDLSDVIKENIYILESAAENKNISVTSSVQENVKVFADENMIKTVLRNLISNGIKFTNNGGYVKISSKLVKNEMVVIIEDNGIGMDRITKETLFNLEEFASSEGTAGERGTGFGLVLCKEFIEKNGGNIWVESEVKKGSKFMFTVPVSG